MGVKVYQVDSYSTLSYFHEEKLYEAWIFRPRENFAMVKNELTPFMYTALNKYM